MFSDYLKRWNLTPDGAAIVRSTSLLLPVRTNGAPAMLKIVTLDEERRSGLLMAWWGGSGAARVLAHSDSGDAVLLERAVGGRSLAQLVRDGADDEATRILCAVAATLHAPRATPPPVLTPLVHWFRPLTAMAAVHGGVLAIAAQTAAELLASPQETVVLHGDLHHANVLDFGSRGWLAIDPKGLTGERSFDYANLFCNPDFAVASQPERFRRQVAVVAGAANLPRERLLAWVLAWTGLSAAFCLEDRTPAQQALALAELAAREAGR